MRHHGGRGHDIVEGNLMKCPSNFEQTFNTPTPTGSLYKHTDKRLKNRTLVIPYIFGMITKYEPEVLSQTLKMHALAAISSNV